MASITDYEAYHNYILGACGAFTANASTMMLIGNDVFDENGEVLTKLTLEHVQQYADQGQKDSLLFDCLRQLERFEQTAENLNAVSSTDPVREIDGGSVPTPTPTP